jgi:antitoxin VapB
MDTYRHVKLFKNGRSQAVRIPREFELRGENAIMHREGDKLVVEAAPAASLLAVLAQLSPIVDVFPDIDDPLPRSVEF